MSYRERIFRLSKTKYNNYKDLSENEIIKKYSLEDIYEFYYEILNPEELHYFGNNETQNIKLKNFFNFKLNDITFKIIKKDEFKQIIENFVKRIKDANINLMKTANKMPDDTEAVEKIKRSISRHTAEWTNILTLNFDDKNKFLDSWWIDYDVFNLLYIYKTTDWDNEFLCLYGS